MPIPIETNIGFTGTRNGMTEYQLHTFHDLLIPYSGWFHHGDCIGADVQAHDIAVSQGFNICIHPPLQDTLRAYCCSSHIAIPLNYLARNHEIVNAANLLIAAPNSEKDTRSGTWSTIRYASKRNKRIIIIWADGSIDRA